ncbi:MAG: LacI family DNA-binding transcriptional regulator [Phycisphaerae bacterium]
MGSVREIAKELGISPATVSRAINNHPAVAEKVRRRVVKAMNRSRYVPAVGKRETMNIAFAYTGDSSLGSPFDAALMQGMSQRMDQFGFDLLILDVRRAVLPHESFSQMCVRKGIRGAVLRTTTETRHTCETIAEEGFPTVVVGDRFISDKINFIASDSQSTSREAVAHLIHLGHKRIGIAINVVDDSDHTDRLNGYKEALTAAGMPVDEKYIYRVPAHREGGVQWARRLATMPDRPSALYCTDPMTAVGVLSEVQQIGWKIPDDLSIIGFDDSDIRFLTYPTLTAICQDAQEIGREAFEALSSLLSWPGNGSAEPLIQRVLPTQLELHGTTGAPNRGK